MKAKPWPTAVLSTTFLANSSPALATEYLVKKGDTFTSIVEKFSRASETLSYSQMLALTLKLNNKDKLSDLDYLKIGQKLNIPMEQDEKEYLAYYKNKYPDYWNPWLWKIGYEVERKYTVNPGDSLSKIARKFMPGMPLFGEGGSVNLLKEKNIAVVNINKIFAGQELVIPTDEDILAYQQNYNIQRMPASIQAGKIQRSPAKKNIVRPKVQKKVQVAEETKEVEEDHILLEEDNYYEGNKHEPIITESDMQELEDHPEVENKRVPSSEDAPKKSKDEVLEVAPGFKIEFKQSLEEFNEAGTQVNNQMPKGPGPGFNIPHIEGECSSSIQVKCFSLLNRELLKSKDNEQTLNCLENLRQFSRECGKVQLEDFYLTMGALFKRPEKQDFVYSMLKAYFIKNRHILELLQTRGRQS